MTCISQLRCVLVVAVSTNIAVAQEAGSTLNAKSYIPRVIVTTDLGADPDDKQVHENLKKHDPMYPAPDRLRSVTYEGGSGTWGKKGTENIGEGKDSEASDALIAIVDKRDPRPIDVSVWGDCSVVAQAIWKVKRTRGRADFQNFLRKLRIHQIATQDGSIGWLRDNFSNLFIIHSAKTYQGMFGGRDPVSDLTWVNEHIRKNHGPLCDV